MEPSWSGPWTPDPPVCASQMLWLQLCLPFPPFQTVFISSLIHVIPRFLSQMSIPTTCSDVSCPVVEDRAKDHSCSYLCVIIILCIPFSHSMNHGLWLFIWLCNCLVIVCLLWDCMPLGAELVDSCVYSCILRLTVAIVSETLREWLSVEWMREYGRGRSTLCLLTLTLGETGKTCERNANI